MPSGEFGRGSCTDPTWQSPECPKFCTHLEDGGYYMVSCANVTQTDTFYCCTDRPYCCDRGIGRQEILPPPSVTWATWNPEQTRYNVVNPLATGSTTISSLSSSSTSSSASFSSSSLTSSSSASSRLAEQPSETRTTANPGDPEEPDSGESNFDESTGLTKAAQAGIGVGAVGGALLIAAVAYLWWRLDRTQKVLAAYRWPDSSTYPPPAPEHKYYHQQQPPAERQYHSPYQQPAPFESAYFRAPAPKHELQGGQDCYELQAQNVFVNL
ncbi:hypothetical protein VTH82DRAFT_5955 [Thermothelomyces myriococcoides]